jgi:hypothetical protein
LSFVKLQRACADTLVPPAKEAPARRNRKFQFLMPLQPQIMASSELTVWRRALLQAPSYRRLIRMAFC